MQFLIVKEADQQQIKDLFIEGGWWNNENDKNEFFIGDLIRNTYLFAIAKCDDRIVGMGRVLSEGISDAYIQDVVVLKDYRKHGVGGGIIRLLLKELIKQNISWIGLISVPGAEKFYKEIGFEVMKDHTPFIYKKKD